MISLTKIVGLSQIGKFMKQQTTTIILRFIKLIYCSSFLISLLLVDTVQANSARNHSCMVQCAQNYAACSNSVADLCRRQHIQVMDSAGRITTPAIPTQNQLMAFESCRVHNITKATGCHDVRRNCEKNC